jgi:4'-phosphopantetheinyl transferase EntD
VKQTAEARRLEAALTQSLGLPLRLAVACEPLAAAALSPAGRARLARYGEARRQQWLLGRAALSALLRRLHRADDAATLTLPQPSLSLTHAGGLAIALGCDRPGVWLGVDFEAGRKLRPGLGRLFLQPAEAHSLAAADNSTLLRVWTAKEAAFKADPANRGAVLRDYVLDTPLASHGTARRGTDFTARYDSQPLANGWLSAAVGV